MNHLHPLNHVTKMMVFRIENDFYWAIIKFGKRTLPTLMELLEPDFTRLGPAQEKPLWITARKHLARSELILALPVSRLFPEPRASLFF